MAGIRGTTFDPARERERGLPSRLHMGDQPIVALCGRTELHLYAFASVLSPMQDHGQTRKSQRQHYARGSLREIEVRVRHGHEH